MFNPLHFLSRRGFRREMIDFFKNLALMVQSGVPLDEALKILEVQTRRRSFKTFLAKVGAQIKAGSPLSKALIPYRDEVGELSVNIIRAGEINGTLEQNLQYLATILTRRMELKQKIQATLLYPEIVLVLAFVLGGGISIFIFPRLIPLFQSLDVKLPLATRLMLWLSMFLRDYGWQVFLGLIVVFVAIALLQRLTPIRRIFHALYLYLPFFGHLTRSYQLALFNQIFGALFSSGLTIKESLAATAEAMTNLKYREALKNSTKRLSSGVTLAAILNKYPKLFSQNVVALVSVGEKSGKLEESFVYLAAYYDSEVEVLTKRLPTLIEPVLLMVIGVVVAFIAVAVIMPIYEFSSSLSR